MAAESEDVEDAIWHDFRHQVWVEQLGSLLLALGAYWAKGGKRCATEQQRADFACLCSDIGKCMDQVRRFDVSHDHVSADEMRLRLRERVDLARLCHVLNVTDTMRRRPRRSHPLMRADKLARLAEKRANVLHTYGYLTGERWEETAPLTPPQRPRDKAAIWRR